MPRRGGVQARFRRVLQGAFLGLGAPLGWAVVRHFSDFGQADEVYEYWLYFYMALGSMLSFGVFGYFSGRDEDSLARKSMQDGLTGLFNTRYFQATLQAEFAVHRRGRSPLSLIMFDLDHFKQVNDRHGHPAGDRVLAAVSEAAFGQVRAMDTLARVGGEEFGVILPGTDSEGGRLLAERIRQAIRDTPVLLAPGREVRMTVSLGVAGTDRTGADDPDRLYALADAALYRAKGAGRDQVVVAGQAPGNGGLEKENGPPKRAA